LLRDIYVIKNLQKLFHIQFGSSLDWDTFFPIVQSLSTYFEKAPVEDKIDVMNIGDYRITYATDVKNGLFFIFLSDLTDAPENLEKELVRAREEFTSMFEEIINESTDEATFSSFKPVAEMIHQNLRPKIALVGYSGVGKTTISKLIRAEEIPMEHIPTMTGSIVTIKIGKLFFHLWDFAGQEQFSFLWPDFIQDSDAVLLVSDSTVQNIDKSKFFIDLAKREVPHARLCVIANKQDLPDAITPSKIEKLLGVKTHGMIAVDPKNRAKMIQIIGDVLDLSPQISPLIRPLLDRDKAMEEAEAFLMQGNLEGAIEKFNSIAKYSRELGDDKIAQEFLERVKQIKSQIHAQGTIPEQTQIPSFQEKKITPAEAAESVPPIPEDSKPIHPQTSDSESTTITSEPLQSTPSEVSTDKFEFKPSFSSVDRKMNSFLSSNYLGINLLQLDKSKIATNLTNPPPSLLEIVKTAQAKLDLHELQIASDSQVPQEPPFTTNRPPQISKEFNATKKKGDTTDTIETLQESLNHVLNNNETSPKAKIQSLKKLLSQIEIELTRYKSKLDSHEFSKSEYKDKVRELKEKKRLVQDKISELSIQEIKNFKVLLPEE